MSPYQDHAVLQSHLALWQTSGLTQAAFCQAHGIKPHIFCYYKKKFSSKATAAKRSSYLIPVKLVADEVPPVPNVSLTSGSGVIRLSHAVFELTASMLEQAQALLVGYFDSLGEGRVNSWGYLRVRLQYCYLKHQ
jgi:hypothetical protein